jgi:hypothetical protein
VHTQASTTSPGISIGMRPLDLHNWQTPVFLCTISALILFSFFANVLVVRTITHKHSLSMPPNWYVLSLAFGDFFQSIVVMPVSAYINLGGINSVGCKFWIVIASFCGLIYVFSHVAIVINRYLTIASPPFYVSENRCVIALWIFGLVMYLVQGIQKSSEI